MGRKCSVPHCYTGYRQCKEKAALYKVPDDDFFLGKWQDAIAREDRPLTPKDYVCEKHFKEEDILRRRIIKDIVEEYQRPKLKPDAIPTIFPDLPESISKMTKKRRKMTIDTGDIIDMARNIDDTLDDTDNRLENIHESIEDIPHTSGENDVVLDNEEIDIKTENEESTCTSDNEGDADEQDDPIGPKMYRCDLCMYKTQYAHNLRTHQTKHLSGHSAYMRCDLCDGYKTKWDSVFVNHMKIKHGISLTEVIKCTFCNFKTKIEQCLFRHWELEHPEQIPQFKCLQVFQHCDSARIPLGDPLEISGKSLKSVIRGANPELSDKSRRNPKVKYNCSHCSYKTLSQVLLQKHLLKHQIAGRNSFFTNKKVLVSGFECAFDECRALQSNNSINNNEKSMMKSPDFDLVTIKEERSSDDMFSE